MHARTSYDLILSAGIFASPSFFNFLIHEHNWTSSKSLTFKFATCLKMYIHLYPRENVHNRVEISERFRCAMKTVITVPRTRRDKLARVNTKPSDIYRELDKTRFRNINSAQQLYVHLSNDFRDYFMSLHEISFTLLLLEFDVIIIARWTILTQFMVFERYLIKW